MYKVVHLLNTFMKKSIFSTTSTPLFLKYALLQYDVLQLNLFNSLETMIGDTYYKDVFINVELVEIT